MLKTERLAQVEIASEQAVWDWLAAHHGQAESIWLVTWMKADAERYLPRDVVLDALIAHGWIDGIRRKKSDAQTMQLIGPRQQQAWAQTYKDRAERLIAEGRMHAAGLASIEAGKASGLWDYFADVDALILPDDLEAALTSRPAWDALAPSYRRNVLRWIKLAKTAPTRMRRIAAAAEATAKGEKLPQM